MKGLLFVSAMALMGCSSLKNFFKISDYYDLKEPDFEIKALWVQNTVPIEKYYSVVGSSNLSMSSEENLLVLSNGKDSVVAFETRTGRRHWRFSVKGGAEGPIVLKEGRVYFGGRDGVFYVLSLDSGKAVWTYPTDSTFISSPWVSKSRVYFQTSLGDVYSLNKKTGRKVWERPHKLDGGLSIKGLARPYFYKGTLLVGFGNGWIKAFRALNGTLIWERKLKKRKDDLPFLDVDSTPVVFRSRIYVSNFDGYLYCLDLKTGRVVWKKPYGSSFAVSVDKKESRLYHSTSQGQVVALKASTGSLLWSYSTQGLATAPVLTDRYVWVGEFQGSLKALERKTGALKAFFEPGAGVASSPVFLKDQKSLFFLSKRANLFHLKI